MPSLWRRRGRPPHPEFLTPSEQRVLELIRRGKTNSEIANELAISVPGVKYHVSNLLGKTGASDRTDLANWKPTWNPSSARHGLWFLPGAWKGTVAFGAVVCVGVAAWTTVAWSSGGTSESDEAFAIAPISTPDRLDLTSRVPRTVDTGFGWRYAIDSVVLDGGSLRVLYHAQGDTASLTPLPLPVPPPHPYPTAPFSENGMKFSLRVEPDTTSVTVLLGGAIRAHESEPSTFETGDWRLTIPLQ
ncbi:MAG: response regulator transcription factor [Dehalococcoidia bacterium]